MVVPAPVRRGRRLAIDTVVRHAHDLALLGDRACSLCLDVDTWLDTTRRRRARGDLTERHVSHITGRPFADAI
jgi:hypothetical protein